MLVGYVLLLTHDCPMSDGGCVVGGSFKFVCGSYVGGDCSAGGGSGSALSSPWYFHSWEKFSRLPDPHFTLRCQTFQKKSRTLKIMVDFGG